MSDNPNKFPTRPAEEPWQPDPSKMPEPRPIPKAIETIGDSSFRQQATDAWRAASQLRRLMELWGVWLHQLETTGDADPGLAAVDMPEAVSACLKALYTLGANVPTIQRTPMQQLRERFPRLVDFEKDWQTRRENRDRIRQCIRGDHNKALKEWLDAPADQRRDVPRRDWWSALMGELLGVLQQLEVAPSTAFIAPQLLNGDKDTEIILAERTKPQAIPDYTIGQKCRQSLLNWWMREHHAATGPLNPDLHERVRKLLVNDCDALNEAAYVALEKETRGLKTPSDGGQQPRQTGAEQVAPRERGENSLGETCTPLVVGTVPNLLFISYSHADKRFLTELLKHLKPLVRNGLVSKWSDLQIAPGSEWEAEIQNALAKTKRALMLVSPDFLDSDFIHDHELGPLLKQAEQGGVRILWIPIRASSYKLSGLSKYQALSPPEKPLAKMQKAKRDEAWVLIVERINESMRDCSSSEPGPDSAPHALRQGGDLVGVWEGISDGGGFVEIWTIKMKNGIWSVTGVHKKDDAERGSFEGRDYQFAGDTLAFIQQFRKLPDPSWQSGAQMTVRASGDALTFRYKHVRGPEGTVTLSRAKPQ
jgi:hypothetical protein